MLLAALDPWIFSFSAVTVIATIWMGFRSARTSKTASDFFVAGRSVGVGMNASAISGEYLSAASFMGVAGMVMSSGYDALWYPVCYACGYLFLLLFIAGPLRRFGAYTIPDFAEGRFDSPVFRKIAVVFVLFIGFFYTMPQMKGAGTTLAYIFPGLPYWAGVVLVGAVITLNVALGGMKGITLVQAFQYWMKMFAISVPIFVLMAVYGHYGRQLEVNAEVRWRAPDGLQQVGYMELLNSPPVTNLFKLHTPRVGFTNSPEWKLRLMSMIGLNNYRRLHLKGFEVEGMSGRTDPGASLELHSLIGEYGKIKGKVTVAAAATEQLRASVPWPAKKTVYGAECLRLYQRVLRENGFVIFQETSEQVTFAHTNILVPIERVLPAKAPSDSAWLSPFGPLTTKAAKATAAAMDKAPAATLPLAAGLTTDQRLTVHLDSPTPAQALGVYGELTGRQLAPRTNSIPERIDDLLGGALTKLRLISAAPVPDNGVRFHNDGPFTVGEVKSAIETNLRTNGLAIVPVGERAFAVEPFTGSPGQSWLTKHERPLALLYTYSLIIALVCGTAGLPHILVRFYTNPDGVAAKRTTMWVMILIGVFYVFPPVFGVLGRNLMPELYEGVGAKGTDKIVLELPRLLNERVPMLGSILSGITCAGAFAAFMSTFSGLLVSMTGALAHDVYGRILRPNATAEERMRMFKIGAVILGAVAILLGMQVERLQINFMVGQAFAIAAASYFPLLFMAVWWRKLTMKGAAVGMLTGGFLAVIAISLTSLTDLGALPLNAFWAANPLLRILCEQPAIWAVPLAIGLMVIVSKLTQATVPADIRMKMLVLHAPEKLGLKQEYIQEHQPGH